MPHWESLKALWPLGVIVVVLLAIAGAIWIRDRLVARKAQRRIAAIKERDAWAQKKQVEIGNQLVSDLERVKKEGRLPVRILADPSPRGLYIISIFCMDPHLKQYSIVIDIRLDALKVEVGKPITVVFYPGGRFEEYAVTEDGYIAAFSAVQSGISNMLD
jgi:hypothetical protein